MRNHGKENNKLKPKNKKWKENGVGLVIHSVNHKVNRKTSTGLEHQGRRERTQRIPGKEHENGNCRRHEKAGKKQKD
jgi:hypothetical protein